MNWLEILGVGIGLLYLYWEYRASVWLWAAGVVMPAIYLVVYWDAGLYADFGISIYYLIASAYGAWCWLRARSRRPSMTDQENSDVPAEEDATEGIRSTPRKEWLSLLLVFLGLFLMLGFLLSRFTDSTVPWADSFSTSLSIVAMWMLAKKYLEQWLVWIVADVACMALYLYKDLWFTGGLYGLYAVIAVAGYRKWRKLMEEEKYKYSNNETSR